MVGGAHHFVVDCRLERWLNWEVRGKLEERHQEGFQISTRAALAGPREKGISSIIRFVFALMGSNFNLRCNMTSLNLFGFFKEYWLLGVVFSSHILQRAFKL